MERRRKVALFVFLERNMPFANQKEFKELRERVEELEKKLGIGVVIPEIEHVLTLYDVYGDDIAELLVENFKTPDAVKVASDEELLAVNGIGPATVKRIRKAGQGV